MTAPSRRRVTLGDVAQRANVDRSVVSRVVNNDPLLNVRPSTRARVQAAVTELGYRPNAMARSLRTARAYTYGLFIPDFTNPIYASIITGAEAAAGARGCLLFTSSWMDHDSPGYLGLLGQGRVDGLLLAGWQAGGTFAERIDALDVPWLFLNRRTPDARRFVVLDDERAAALAVEHLVTLGHRRIAHLAGPSHADTAQRRAAGYRAAVAAAGAERDERLVVEADYTNVGGAAGIQELLAADDPPTAVFVANVASAVGALHGAREAGFTVPDDLSIVAVHDLPLAGFLQPPLTTVRMPLAELGRRGIELLATVPVERPVQEVLGGPMELVVRGSTAPPTRRPLL